MYKTAEQKAAAIGNCANDIGVGRINSLLAVYTLPEEEGGEEEEDLGGPPRWPPARASLYLYYAT